MTQLPEGPQAITGTYEELLCPVCIIMHTTWGGIGGFEGQRWDQTHAGIWGTQAHCFCREEEKTRHCVLCSETECGTWPALV